jgi:hypothetical protein
MRYIFLTLLLFTLTFSQTIQLTEVPHGTDMEYYFTGVCDSGTVTSGSFQLSKYDASVMSYPLGFALVFDTLSADGEITAVYVQGKAYGGTYAIVDTLFVADTLESGGTIFKGSANLNITSWGFPEYRIAVMTSTAKGNTFRIKLSLYAYKED